MSSNLAIIADLSRIENAPIVQYYGSIIGKAHPTMFDAAEAQYQQIHDLMLSENFTSTQITISISNIKDSLHVYRDRIAQIKQDPEAPFGEYFPGATVAQVTLGMRRRTVGLFEQLVDDIENQIPKLRDLCYDKDICQLM